MQTGPPKARPKYTSGYSVINGYVIMTTEELIDFNSFYVSFLDDGHYDFDATHPRTGSTEQMKFMEPPTYNTLGDGTWKVSMHIKVIG